MWCVCVWCDLRKAVSVLYLTDVVVKEIDTHTKGSAGAHNNIGLSGRERRQENPHVPQISLEYQLRRALCHSRKRVSLV